jgi:hypothetical protein
LALVAAGALTILINIGLSPFMVGQGRPLTEIALTPLFLWRQSLSALVAGLLLFGSAGLYLRQADRAGRFGGVAFVITFVGTALLLAWEWIDIFIVRDLAIRATGTLRMLEEAKGVHLYDLGAIIPVALFALGWIAFAASTFRVIPRLRPAAALVIAGFFATPLLSAAFGPAWGGALGNMVLGSGWILLGLPTPLHASTRTER